MKYLLVFCLLLSSATALLYKKAALNTGIVPGGVDTVSLPNGDRIHCSTNSDCPKPSICVSAAGGSLCSTITGVVGEGLNEEECENE
ncbi:unnamed protein product, partial [Mesorhabditis spiculigera]